MYEMGKKSKFYFTFMNIKWTRKSEYFVLIQLILFSGFGLPNFHVFLHEYARGSNSILMSVLSRN